MGGSLTYDVSLLDDYDFPAHHYTRAELCQWSVVMMNELNMGETLQVTDDHLLTFITEVAKRYQRCAYHNFTHAFCLAHACYWAVKSDHTI